MRKEARNDLRTYSGENKGRKLISPATPPTTTTAKHYGWQTSLLWNSACVGSPEFLQKMRANWPTKATEQKPVQHLICLQMFLFWLCLLTISYTPVTGSVHSLGGILGHHFIEWIQWKHQFTSIRVLKCFVMPHVTLGDSSEPPTVAQDNKNN